MPIPNYSVLKGRPSQGRVFPPGSPRDMPHYHILVQNSDADYDVAVNIQSQDGSEVLFRIQSPFTPPEPDALLALGSGLTPLSGDHHDLALDYVRQHLVQRDQMSLLPISAASPTPLQNQIDALIQNAIQQTDAVLFAFGSAFSDPARNPFFSFQPDAGVHDIHMNQGNPPSDHGGDNGSYQDGALFIWLPSENMWNALFIAFQSQSFAG